MSRNPDIQRLLASLRGGMIDGNTNYTESPIPGQSTTGHPTTNEAKLRSDQPVSNAPSSNNVHLGQTAAAKLEAGQNRSASPITPDASMITTWPSAVKFITKHIATNDKLEAKIKRLITTQHKHEREWWQQRQNIIKTQSGRADNQQKAADLLRSLGGTLVPAAPTDPSTELAELEAFDLKVHRSLTQLATHYDSELKQMGIPFFAIKKDLVLPAEDEYRQDVTKRQLDQVQLKDLQKRILIYLEELFGDETASTE